MSKTLRTLSAPGFTTKGSALSWSELDTNFIEIWEATIAPAGVEVVSAASYNITTADQDKLLIANDTGTQSFTIPAESSQDFEIGSIISFSQNNGGTISIEGDTGVTVNVAANSSNILNGDYAVAAAIKTGSDTWLLVNATSSNITSFISLDDTPGNYSGAAGRFVKVNSTPSGLEFVAAVNLANEVSGKLSLSNIVNIAANRLLGRVSSTGSMQEIQLGENLSFDGITLNASGGAGITETDTWVLTTDPSGSGVLTSVAQSSLPGFAQLGSGMSASSGIFTFPSTGLWRIEAFARFDLPANEEVDELSINIDITLNNNDFNPASVGWTSLFPSSSDLNSTAAASFDFNVTNTTNRKCRFRVNASNSNARIRGGSAGGFYQTYFKFTRLGDAVI